MDNSKNTKRIVKNTMLLYFRMILILAVSLYTSRVVLNTLGVEDFGIYNVVGGLVTMFIFLNGAMSTSTQRFLSFEIGRKDSLQLNKTFNVTLGIHTVLAFIIFILLETIGLWLLNKHLTIPIERMVAAHWVFQFSAISVFISIIRVPYNAVILAHERMNIYAYISILEVLLKLLVVFILTWLTFDSLVLYSLLLLSVNLIIFLFYVIYSKSKFEETTFEIVKDLKLYKSILSYSGWNLFGNLALVSKNQGVTIILNIFFGPVVNAAQAIANQVNTAVLSFYSNFQTAVNPQIIKSYAAEQKEYMISLILKSAKFSIFLLFILSAPLLFEIDFVLQFWLKNVPDYAANFTMLILIIALVDSISGPLMTGIQATGNIKYFQMIVGSLQLMILPITYLFFKFQYSPETTYIVVIAISFISLFIRLHILKSLVNGFSTSVFIKEVVIKSLITIMFSVSLPFLLKYFIQSRDTLTSIFVMVTSVVSTALSIYFIGINAAERNSLNLTAKNGINNISHIVNKLIHKTK